MDWAARRLAFLGFALVASLAVLVLGGLGPAGANALDQGLVVSDDPVEYTPHVLDGQVNAIVTVGDTVVVGGDFTQVREAGTSNIQTRNYLFAFDRTTGDVSSTFVPALNGEVWTLHAASDGTSVFVGGSFATVNGTSNFGIAKLDVASGAQVAGFDATTAGKVRDLVVHGGKVYLGGDIWSVNGVPRSRLAAVDEVTGAVDPSFTVSTTQARVSVDWVTKLDVSPDGSAMVIVGNFVEVDGLPREQVAVIDLTGPTAQVADWSTDQFTASCSGSFWTYMRDIEYDPDGGYFVIATTGGPYVGTLCDTATRWESNASGSGLLETWADWSGGDTLTAVAISDVAVYIGGHQRWMNNHLGRDNPTAAAVVREGITALDPINGVPLAWNPGKDRGVAVFDLHLSDLGLYVGSDTDFTAGEYHPKLAQFPLAGGTSVPVPTPARLPSGLYSGAGMTLTVRSFDGASLGGDGTVPGNVLDYDSVLGVFHQAGDLYYLESGSGDLHSRTFDGVSMGPEVTEPSWVDWSSATAAGWLDGRLYYTVLGSDELRYRYFSLESGIVGSQTFVVSGNGDGLDWTDTRGIAFADGKLHSTTAGGDLYVIDMADGAPVPGTEMLLSGPSLGDGRDWSGSKIFFYEADLAPTVTITDPTAGAIVQGGVTVAASVADDNAVTEVEFLVDGVSLGVDDNGGDGWSVPWDTTTSLDGPVAVSAIATDDVGQTATDEITVTVDNNAPTVAITAPLDGATVGGTIAVLADASDAAGVAQVEFFVDGVSIGVDDDGADGWSAAWDSTASPDGVATLSATATDGAGQTDSDSIGVTVSNAGDGVVVMVVADPDALSSGDAAVRDRLQSLGFVVSLVDDNGVTPATASGASFVIVSSSVSGVPVGDTFKDVPEPVWMSKPWLLDDMGMTGVVAGADYGTTSASTYTIVDPANPLSAGLSGDVVITSGTFAVSWGVPGAAGNVAATANGLPTVFSYQPGETLADGTTAAGCRLAVSIYQQAPVAFTTDGWAIFDATANYAAAGCGDAPPFVSLTAPPDGATVSGSIPVSATASDDGTVTQVEFLVDGVSLAVDTDGTDGWSTTWDTTTSSDGAVVLEAIATDDQGQTDSDLVTVTVDNVVDLPPTVAITAPPAGATVAGVVTIAADAGDDVGVTQVEFFVEGVSVGVDTDGADGWSSDWDSAAGLDGLMELTATATDTGGQTSSDTITVTVDNGLPPVVVMVVGNVGNLGTGDTAVRDRLQTLGYTVTIVDDDAALSGDATGASFVLVTSTVNAGAVGATFYEVDEPVWMAKPWAFDDMGMTGPAGGTDYGSVNTTVATIVDPAHPLAAGYSGDVTMTSKNARQSWGVPAPAASVVATADGLPTTFVYQAGEMLADGTPAAGCRLTFSIFQSAPANFTADGQALFDATVAYLADGCG